MGRAGIVVNVMCVYGYGVTWCTSTWVCGVRVRGYVVYGYGAMWYGYGGTWYGDMCMGMGMGVLRMLEMCRWQGRSECERNIFYV